MSQAGYTPISLYYSTTAAAVPLAANLAAGELAINTTDGKLYYKSNGGVVTLLASSTTVTNSFSAGTTGLTPNTATTGAVTLAGTLITSNGGTGLSTYTAGDLSYYASGTALSKLAIGTSGYLLTSSGTAPQWSNSISIGAGTFTSVTDSGLTSGRVTYATTGGLLTDSANLTFNGTTTLSVSSSLSGASNYMRVINSSNTANSGALLSLQTGGTSGGTAAIEYYNQTTAIYAGATTSYASYFVGANASGATPYFSASSTGLAVTNAISATTSIKAGTSVSAQGTFAGFTGAGAFISYEGTYGRFEAYDYGTSAYKDLHIAQNGGNVAIGAAANTLKLYVYQSAVGVGAFGATHVNGNSIQVAPSYNYYNAYNHVFSSLSGSSEYARFFNTGSFLLGTNSASGAKMDLAFSTTQNGLVIAPTSYVYPTYSLLTTNGVISTIKSGSGTIRLLDIRAQEQTSTANGQVIGGYFQIDNPNAAVNANGGQIGVYGLVNGVNNYTVGHQYGVYGRAGSGGTYGIGVMAVLGADITLGYRAALVAVTNNTTDRIASFQNSGGEYVQINGLGSVGVATVPNRWFSNRSVIQMGSSVGAISAQNGYEIGVNFYVAETTAADKRVQSGYANKIYADAADGDIRFATAGTGAADSNISWSERMRLVNGGNLLIGTTTAPYQAVTTAGSLVAVGSINSASGNLGNTTTGTSYTLFTAIQGASYIVNINAANTASVYLVTCELSSSVVTTTGLQIQNGANVTASGQTVRFTNNFGAALNSVTWSSIRLL